MYEIYVDGKNVATLSKTADALTLGTFLYAQGNCVDVVSTATGEVIFYGKPNEMPTFSNDVRYAL